MDNNTPDLQERLRSFKQIINDHWGLSPIGAEGLFSLAEQLSADLTAVRAELEGEKNHVKVLNAAIANYVEAASVFQIGGALYDVAKLRLGGSTVVDGIAWLLHERERLQGELIPSRHQVGELMKALEDYEKQVVNLQVDLAALRAERDEAQQLEREMTEAFRLMKRKKDQVEAELAEARAQLEMLEKEKS